MMSVEMARIFEALLPCQSSLHEDDQAQWRRHCLGWANNRYDAPNPPINQPVGVVMYARSWLQVEPHGLTVVVGVESSATAQRWRAECKKNDVPSDVSAASRCAGEGKKTKRDMAEAAKQKPNSRPPALDSKDTR